MFKSVPRNPGLFTYDIEFINEINDSVVILRFVNIDKEYKIVAKIFYDTPITESNTPDTIKKYLLNNYEIYVERIIPISVGY